MGKVLWGPKRGKCSSCGCNRDSTRSYTSESSMHTFCLDCWSDVLRECRIGKREWTAEVLVAWDDDVVFILVPEAAADGATPDTGTWS
jgi:hypothetical protein